LFIARFLSPRIAPLLRPDSTIWELQIHKNSRDSLFVGVLALVEGRTLQAVGENSEFRHLIGFEYENPKLLMFSTRVSTRHAGSRCDRS
jgi:hypothetical protein